MTFIQGQGKHIPKICVQVITPHCGMHATTANTKRDGQTEDGKKFKNLTRLTLVKLTSNCNSVSHKTHCRDYVRL